MKIILAHDDAPEGLPGHHGVVRNVQSMGFMAVAEAMWQLMLSLAARAELVKACGKIGERKYGEE